MVVVYGKNALMRDVRKNEDIEFLGVKYPCARIEVAENGVGQSVLLAPSQLEAAIKSAELIGGWIDDRVCYYWSDNETLVEVMMTIYNDKIVFSEE